ncbi:ComF family protein [Bacillus aquiflavi]|uniref:ComF family protein n=1 Tax=Bacillus aquiflavi TaxID=2672567 RepID=UPI001CA89ADE|nr:ComF family protein [Bacillus aquiflavi]UAC47851.1 ComF family protein [Bacillus aquiflavi]
MSSLCLLCSCSLTEPIGWRSLFTLHKTNVICRTCQEQLEEISGETCGICNRLFNMIDDQFRHGDLCYDCVRWETDAKWSGLIERNHSLFVYNDFLKEVLMRFKFRGDYIISKVFCQKIIETLNDISYDILVPIPLSEERLYERGFNQAEALIQEAGLKSVNALTRIHTEKKSKKSRMERIHLEQVFRVTEPQIKEKRIVLVDDIYTTGSTLRHAAKMLKEAGAKSVSSLTVARG